MSHVRKAALFLVIATSAFAGWQHGAASADAAVADRGLPIIDLAAPGSLRIVKGWCADACTNACETHEGCNDYTPVGCTCYWLCNDGEDGATICTGAIGVKVCNDVASIMSRPNAASMIRPLDTM